MQNFSFSIPTKIVFGKNSEDKTPELVKIYGGSRVFLIYGGGSAVKSGLIQKLTESFSAAGIPCQSKGGVQPNPLLQFAEELRKDAQDFHADFVLGVGGGSVLDTAKAVAHGLANPGTSIWDIWQGKVPLTKTTPVGAVLTIPAAGSETSDSAVLTNPEEGRKLGLNIELNRPKFAIMNPELTYTLPKYHLACGIVDIMMHTMDRYFTYPNGNQLTDALAEALLRVVIENGPKALANQHDYHAMSELMWAGSLSHNDLTGLGSPKDFTPHQLAHEPSAKYNTIHGATLSVIWGWWARYSYKEHPERFAQFGRNVWGIQEENTDAAAVQAIERTVSFFASLNMPTTFSELGIGILPEEDLAYMADSCVYFGKRTVGKFKVLGRDDIYQIYKSANH